MKLKLNLTLILIIIILSGFLIYFTFTYQVTKTALINVNIEKLKVVVNQQEKGIIHVVSAWIDRFQLINRGGEFSEALNAYFETDELLYSNRIDKILRDSQSSVGMVEQVTFCPLVGQETISIPENSVLDLLCDDLHSEVLAGSLGNGFETHYSEKKLTKAVVLPNIISNDSQPQVALYSNRSILKNYKLTPIWLPRELGHSKLKFVISGIVPSKTKEVLGTLHAVYSGNELVKVIAGDLKVSESSETLIAQSDINSNTQLITPLRYGTINKLSPDELGNLFTMMKHSLSKKNSGVKYLFSDYRGKPVFAVTALIEELNWGLLAKIDKEEVLAPISILGYQLFYFGLMFLIPHLLIGALLVKRIVFTESTQEKHLLSQPKKEEDFVQEYKFVLNTVEEGVIKVDSDCNITFVNAATISLLGYKNEELIGQPLKNLLPYDGKDSKDQSCYHSIKNALEAVECVSSTEEVFQRKNRSNLYVKCRVTPLIGLCGNVSSAIMVFRDITEERQYIENIDYLAHYDALTKLPNRMRCVSYLMESIERASTKKNIIAILYVDIDEFKNINAYYGNEVGDIVLLTLADRIRQAVGRKDFIARFGGDEFVIVITEGAEDNRIKFITKSLLATIARPLSVGQLTLKVTGSVGIACYPKDGTLASGLLRNADQAMYESKLKGYNRYHSYDDQLRERITRENYLREGLIKAISNKTIQVHYQPISDSLGAISGFESLCRWTFDGKEVDPSEFIRVAEKCNIIDMLGKYVFDSAIDFLDKIKKKTQFNGYVSINVSLHQLNTTAFAQYMVYNLERRKIPIDRCLIEITESKIVENFDSYQKTFDYMVEQNFSMALDDFGTGYASFEHLRLLPIKYLKIDKSFIENVPENQEAASTVATMLMLGNALKLKTIVEGVENKRQSEWLKQFDCYQQGFFFSKPAAQNNFIDIV